MKGLSNFEQRIQCLNGTFAVENLTISPDIQKKLRQLEAGKADYSKLVRDAVQRHTRKP